MADSPPLPCGEAEGPQSTLEEGLQEMDEQRTAAQLAAAHTVRVVAACRQFARALDAVMSEDPQLRRAVRGALNPTHIKEAFAAIDLSELLTPEYAAGAMRRAQGYSQWLAAPELGVRGLIREAVALCRSPMEGVLAQVHEALLQGAELAALRCASDAAGRRESDTAELAECEAAVGGASSAAGDGLDELVHWLEQRAKSCVDRHRQEASRLLDQLLESEARSPCPGDFAALKLKLEALLQAVAEQEQGVAEAALAALGDGAGPQAEEQAAQEAAAAVPEPTAPEAVFPEKDDSHEFFMGYLEKLNRRGRWQKRWFVLSPATHELFYYASAEEEIARAVVQLRGVKVVSHVLPLASPMVHKASRSRAATDASLAAGHVFQLQLPDPGRDGGALAALTLRADGAASKTHWVSRLQAAAEAKPKAPTAGAAAAEEEQEGASSAQQQPPTGSVARKISTRVFPDPLPQAPTGAAPAAAGAGGGEQAGQGEGAGERPLSFLPRTARGRAPSSTAAEVEQGSGAGAGLKEKEERKEEEGEEGAWKVTGRRGESVGEEGGMQRELSEAAAEALVASIAQQAQQGDLAEQERAVLEAIIEGTIEYVQSAHHRLADLTRKVITSTMLQRADDLYTDLLGILSSHDGASLQEALRD